jgi:hypothetical protein
MPDQIATSFLAVGPEPPMLNLYILEMYFVGQMY